jgi:3',5'-cyclic AMP phosphodiesterase CpdA
LRLLAISDLHVRHPENRDAFACLGHYPSDWLILGGDVCETVEDLKFVLDTATRRFARVCWIPGNHELWTLGSTQPRGVAKYQAMVDACRAHGVDTPEDPFPIWEGPGGRHVVALLFLLYDYSFRPESVPLTGAVDWARGSFGSRQPLPPAARPCPGAFTSALHSLVRYQGDAGLAPPLPRQRCGHRTPAHSVDALDRWCAFRRSFLRLPAPASARTGAHRQLPPRDIAGE